MFEMQHFRFFLKNILIIQDENHPVDNLYAALSSTDDKIYLAGENDGLDIALRYPPDIIISHLINPDAELELIKNLNRNSLSTIILIVITSGSDRSHSELAMQLGADLVFTEPCNIENLKCAIINKLRKKELLREQILIELTKSLEKNPSHKSRNDHVLVKIGNKIKLIEFPKIIFIVALKEYSKIMVAGGQKIVIRKSLCNWLEILPVNSFLRIHRGTIINLKYLDRMVKSGLRSYNVFLKDVNEPFALSQRYANIMRKTFPK